MFYTNFIALMETEAKNAVNLVVGFDNEEVGSGSRLGAGSVLLSTVLERIAQSIGITNDDYYAIIQRSFMISFDMAHAIHHNIPVQVIPPLYLCNYAKKLEYLANSL